MCRCAHYVATNSHKACHPVSGKRRGCQLMHRFPLSSKYAVLLCALLCCCVHLYGCCVLSCSDVVSCPVMVKHSSVVVQLRCAVLCVMCFSDLLSVTSNCAANREVHSHPPAHTFGKLQCLQLSSPLASFTPSSLLRNMPAPPRCSVLTV